eukprot:CAMPEP_0204348784 /NCGR_PEP_ID=MMETSP0469-20131031/28996_1 /ASSEMBLY_ACC=CAM_ASM_000384 /TAXON_ID=2969 /ORGANISM="Oxyrrhis marina" /LENGTH=147 /DNA_ID=CAMNT_0051334827 /DNA_START=30 /DNA_END=473 /DNA_ORIENTATION=+
MTRNEARLEALEVVRGVHDLRTTFVTECAALAAGVERRISELEERPRPAKLDADTESWLVHSARSDAAQSRQQKRDKEAWAVQQIFAIRRQKDSAVERKQQLEEEIDALKKAAVKDASVRRCLEAKLASCQLTQRELLSMQPGSGHP